MRLEANPIRIYSRIQCRRSRSIELTDGGSDANPPYNDVNMDNTIQTERLKLRTMSSTFLAASLDGNHAEAERVAGAKLADEWWKQTDWQRIRFEQLKNAPNWAPWLTRLIELKDEQQIIGVIGFHGPPAGEWLDEFAPGGVEFGYTIYATWRRQGFAFEGASNLIQWAAQEHGVRTFILSINSQNHPSASLARKLGFSKVGTWEHEDRGIEDVFRYSRGAPASL